MHAPTLFWFKLMKLLIFFIIVIIIITAWYVFGSSSEEYTRFTRPDGAYKIIVYKQNSPFSFLMPGQGSDAPGNVRLYDKDDNLLKEKNVEMVQLADNVIWSDNHVSIKLVAEWDLHD